MSKALYFLTGNVRTIKAEKAREIQGMLRIPLENAGVDLQIMTLDLKEIQGTSDEIIADKLKRACKKVKAPVLCEDTSLCFEALGGLPGPYM